MRFEKIQLFELADKQVQPVSPVKRKKKPDVKSKPVKVADELNFDITPFLPVLQHYKVYMIQPYVNKVEECYIAQVTLHPKKWLDHCKDISKPNEDYMTLLKDDKSMVVARMSLDLIGEEVFFTRKEANEGLKRYRKKYNIRFCGSEESEDKGEQNGKEGID